MSNALVISIFSGAAGTIIGLVWRLFGKLHFNHDEGPAAKAARDAVQAVEGALTALREERLELRENIKRLRERIDNDQETIKAQREFIKSLEESSKTSERTLLGRIDDLTAGRASGESAA